MNRGTRAVFVALAVFCVLGIAQAASEKPAAPTNSTRKAAGTPGAPRPNILFIVLDDVGIDQMRIFGYGGLHPNSAPNTPNIDTIARNGVRFRNTWAMPECSPSRAMFFEGRYPLRTNIFGAILSIDVANSQLSPYEVTTPNLLKTVGYNSALFGKFHLGGPDNNPYGEGTPHAAGFDYYDGFLEGAPFPIDTSIGGQFSNPATFNTSCGFVPNSDSGGADTGACHFADNSCTVISRDQQHPTPGRSCLEQGGLFVPNQQCSYVPPEPLKFEMENAYYVWHRIINQPDGTIVDFPLTDPSVRHYVSNQTTQSAVDWINMENSQHQPWMATVAFGNIHTPYQQPPRNLLPHSEIEGSDLSCANLDNEHDLRILSNQMLESTDTQIGQILVQTGLASYNSDGTLNYHPEQTNTMVVIIGDNGTYAVTVKLPFNPSLSKATVFQTGVWVPLIISGPVVVAPNREVTSMVNIADLFQLWGELVGIDVHQTDPHTIDSMSMLPYLTNPQQGDIRQVNFTQTQANIHLNNQAPPPCLVAATNPATCVQLFPQKKLCESEGGVWYGPDGANPQPDCCAVQALLGKDNVQLLPDAAYATRNNDYKLIRLKMNECSHQPDATYNEFYTINERPISPVLDNPPDALCDDNPADNRPKCPNNLTPDQLNIYNSLTSSMNNILASQPPCPRDGNEDLLVNDEDLTNWQFFSMFNGGGSSWYDFNFDGHTDEQDEAVIQLHLGTNCQLQQRSQAQAKP